MPVTGHSKLVHWDNLRDGMGREEGGGFRMGTHVHPWLIHVNVWQKPLQYCKVTSLQLKFQKSISLPMQETQVRFLGQEDLLEEEMATTPAFLPENPWTGEPDRLQSMGSQSQAKLSTHTHRH